MSDGCKSEAACQAVIARNADRIAQWRAGNRAARLAAQAKAERDRFWEWAATRRASASGRRLLPWPGRNAAQE